MDRTDTDHLRVALPRPRALVLTSIAATLLLGGLGFGLRAQLAAGERNHIYSVATLDEHLTSDPAAWLHRTVYLRALLSGKCMELAGIYTPACASWSYALTDPDQASTAVPLLLSWGGAPPLLAVLRRVPLVGQLAPAPQILYSGVPAVYRVQVRNAACASTEAAPCYGVELLDARAPDDTTRWIRFKVGP